MSLHPYLSLKKRINTFVLVLGLMIVNPLLGCQILGPDDPRLEDSESHRENWDSFQDGTYSYNINRGCFCAVAGEHFVQVQNGEVIEAFNVWRNEPVPREHFQYLETIEDLFDLILEAEAEADEFSVEYAEQGYPSSISIDWIKGAVDDEMVIQVHNVLPGLALID